MNQSNHQIYGNRQQDIESTSSEKISMNSEDGATERTSGCRGALEPGVEATGVESFATRMTAEAWQRTVIWM